MHKESGNGAEGRRRQGRTAAGPHRIRDDQQVMSDYFETMGIPISQGRSFESTDVGSSKLD